MKLNDQIYAIVSPTGEVLGNGECPAISTIEPMPDEVEHVRRVNECPDARVIECVITPNEYLDGLWDRIRSSDFVIERLEQEKEGKL
jgi:hypothetical protein